MKLLAMLAPLILGMLGKAMRPQGQAPASGGGGLGDLLGGLVGGGARNRGGGGGDILSDLLGGSVGQMQQRSPGMGDMLGGLLDADGDGSMMDDLLERGLGGGRGSARSSGGGDVLGGLLGSLLGGKR
jgi:hypothetical protein